MRRNNDVEGDTEASADDRADDDGYTPTFQYAWAPWSGGQGLRSFYGSGREDTVDEAPREEANAGANDSWWDEGLIGLLLVVGVVLFVFPEPSTSALGILLIVTGVLAWIIEAIAGSST